MLYTVLFPTLLRSWGPFDVHLVSTLSFPIFRCLNGQGAGNVTSVHAHISHIAVAHRAGRKYGLSCACAAQTTLPADMQGGIYDRRDH